MEEWKIGKMEENDCYEKRERMEFTQIFVVRQRKVA